MLKKITISLLLSLGMTLAHASDFSGAIDFDHGNKHYQGNWGEGAVIKNTINVSASWTPGPWSFTLAVPYQQMKYDFSGLIFQGSPYQRLRATLVSKGQTVNGFGDATLSSSYTFESEEKGWWLSPGAVIKWDNGDASQGLGTNTRDFTAQIAGGWDNTIFGIDTLIGQTWVGEDASLAATVQPKDFGFWELATRISPVKWMDLGVRYHDQTKSSDQSPSNATTEWSVAFKPAKRLSIRGYYMDYAEGPGVPKNETGLGVSYKF